MSRRRPTALIVALSVLTLMVPAAPADARQAPQRLADIGRFLMDADQEASLARSAAPPLIGNAATVLVLTRDGHREHARGENGFTCVVQRGWSSPLGAADAFFDPRLVAPICFNAEASRTALKDYLRRTELVMDGSSRAEIAEVILREIGAREIPTPTRTAVAYMLSPHQWIGPRVERWKPHVMIYAPFMDVTDIGANDLDSGFPLVFEHGGGPMATIVLPAPAWSNGVAAEHR